MIKKLVVASLLGGVVLFIWSALSWMVFGFQEANLNHFTDEDAITEAIRSQAPASGMYILPGYPEHRPGASAEEIRMAEDIMKERMLQGPHIFASVRLTGTDSLTPFMVRGFIINVISVFLVALMVWKIRTISFVGKVAFTVVFALAASAAIHLQYWNWWSFSTGYITTSIIDMAIGWFLVGLVLGKVITERKTYG